MRFKQALTAIVCLTGAVACTSCPGMGDMLRLYGYTELRPPSTLLIPGAMVAIRGRSPFEATIICGPRASLGGHWKPVRSATATSELSKYNGKHFKVDAKVMESIKADARFKSVSSITVTLSNASLVEVQDIDIISNRRYRSSDCSEAIRRRLRNGYKITMVQSGLMGDVVYNVRWENAGDVSVQAKVDSLQQLALELGGGATAVSETNIKATGLMWGIRDDAYFAAMSVPELDDTLVEPGTHHVPLEQVAHINPQPDAPVIMPTDKPCQGKACERVSSSPGKQAHLPFKMPAMKFEDEQGEGVVTEADELGEAVIGVAEDVVEEAEAEMEDGLGEFRQWLDETTGGIAK